MFIRKKKIEALYLKYCSERKRVIRRIDKIPEFGHEDSYSSLRSELERELCILELIIKDLEKLIK